MTIPLPPPPPPPLDSLPAGMTLTAGMGTATILPDLDFETYSEAGFVWNEATQKWDGPPNAPGNRKGLSVVGAAVYAEHPTTEVLSLAYDLRDGHGRRRWLPGDTPPHDLLAHIASGGVLEAWNSGFEHWIWNKVCVPKYIWPPLPQRQLRCAMAKARAHALPGGLDDAGRVLNLTHQKDPAGARLLGRFSVPQKPTKKDPRRRILLRDEPDEAAKLYNYNERDIVSEAEASSLVPDLSADELEFWLCDQEINFRGVAMDQTAIANCIAVFKQASERYNVELHQLTGGAVARASELQRLKEWLIPRGVYMFSMDEEAIEEALKRDDIDPTSRRVLELRAKIGSASVKKLFAMRNTMTRAGRLHDLFSFHAARTGRASGNGVQPHNLPKSGPLVYLCIDCKHWFGAHTEDCPWCGRTVPLDRLKPLEWSAAVIENALSVLATRSLDCVELFFGDACTLIVGCLRGLFVAAEGRDLIASDYSAIEAVVLAALAGEEWRLDVFRNKKDIYLASAAKITGNTLEFYEQHKAATGQHHPHRQPFGKVPELALGYGGWTGAMLAFGADEFFSIDEMVENVKRWRAESPAVVEFWGGQFRSLPWLPDYRAEYHGLEGAAVQAILNPGTEYTVCASHPASRPVSYIVRGDALYCRLPSGRYLTYHQPRLTPATKGPHRGHALAITFMGWNTNPKMGAIGWVQMDTYGPKLAENVVQAVARDILAFAIVNLMRAGYAVVLHVHDEIVAEILKGWGSIEEFERIMGTLPLWASGWPLRAAGGWRGLRYRKD